VAIVMIDKIELWNCYTLSSTIVFSHQLNFTTLNVKTTGMIKDYKKREVKYLEL
jgi:hypothetical protein